VQAQNYLYQFIGQAPRLASTACIVSVSVSISRSRSRSQFPFPRTPSLTTSMYQPRFAAPRLASLSRASPLCVGHRCQASALSLVVQSCRPRVQVLRVITAPSRRVSLADSVKLSGSQQVLCNSSRRSGTRRRSSASISFPSSLSLTRLGSSLLSSRIFTPTYICGRSLPSGLLIDSPSTSPWNRR
jgi:hypothetical protein